ncbi:thioesterase II family protein [Streptomyces sp. WMMC1477]|uniref:thioesterase II family protein n=1 Tax=Streptomyces sp. WMMC1477 TaxID=3015155 RepID=UPI0022B6CD21|nr:alpha/beta fold hydrolase [Streptomyces sp. WMMC1477]MCZ7433044.1 alpha/beta fold hydrolase [Streptomyces sp. WMMC1477]
MSAASGKHDTWFRRFQSASSGAVKLVALPHAGGSAPYFLPLARALAPELDVLCVQYPGRQDRYREPLVESLDSLADQLYDALTAEPPQQLVLFGHSMGAVLAFELGRRIERDGGGELLGVIASGRRAPCRHREETVHLRDDDGLVGEIRELSGTDPGVFDDEELLRMVLPALRADYRAVETYRYQPGEPLRAPISTLTGESDTRVTLEEARAWGELTSGSFQFRSFPGGHFYLNGHQAAVTEAIRESVAAFRLAAASAKP